MSAKVAETLRKARALIGTPEDWGQSETGGPRMSRGLCLVQAISRALDLDMMDYAVLETGAYSAVSQAVGSEHVACWNDAPERTHAEVLEAFDKAIALAEAGS